MPALNLRSKIFRLLRKSESFFKTDMVYLAKGGSWMSLGQVINILIGFCVSIAFANFLPKESFGTYKFVLSATAIIGIFSFIDMGTAITQAVARGFTNSLARGFRTNLKWSGGIVLAGFALSAYYHLHGNTLLSFSFLVAALLTPITASAGLYGSYLLGKKDFKRSTVFGMIRNVVPALALVATLFLTQNLAAIIVVYFLSATTVSYLLYRATLRAYGGTAGEDDPDITAYGGHLGLMNILGNIAGNIDKILIFHYLGAAPLAIYAFAVAPVEQLQSGKKILNALILSKLSVRPFEDLQRAVLRRSGILALYAAVLIALYVPLVPYFYQFFYPQYVASIFYSQLYALTLFGIIGSVLDSHLVAHKKMRELYVSRTLAPVITILLYIALIPSLGIIGLVIAQIITRASSGLISYYLVTRPFRDIPSVP